jgi:PadR family transcriptional regulator PadR
MKFDKSLLSGSTQLLVLSIIAESDAYGYEIILKLAEKSENAFEMKEGTLYPVLHSLEKDGYLTAYEQETAGGRKRKYYHVTDKGLKELAAQKEQWKAFAGSVEMVLGGSGA